MFGEKNVKERKYKGKIKRKKIKIKNRLKVDKLFFLFQIYFIYFNSSI